MRLTQYVYWWFDVHIPITSGTSSHTCKLVDLLLWERVLTGLLTRLVLVLWWRSGQVSLKLLVLLLSLLLLETQTCKSSRVSTLQGPGELDPVAILQLKPLL